MNTDGAALAQTSRDIALGFELDEIRLIGGVGVIDLQKPAKARTAMARDDQVVALGRAPIPFPLLCATEAAAAEDGVIGPVELAPVENLNLMMRLGRDDLPVQGVLVRGSGIVQVQAQSLVPVICRGRG
jgi:hypothetical protein